MNRNNQNDYEVIDASNCGCASDDVVQYPLARDPNAVFQNMHYKDYLQTYDGDYTGSFINPNLSINPRDVLQTGINIVGRLLGFLGVPFAGQLVTFYTFLLNQLWPTNDNAVWEAFMAQIEELINQRISEAVVGTAADHLTGLHDNYELYVEALEEWLERPNAARTNLLFNRFTTLDSLFTQFMPSFGTGPGSQNYAVPLLTVYAQAANLHLLLLKDAEIYGARWGLNQNQINSFHTRQQERTQYYTNHCVTTYNTGLDRLRGTNTESWLNYHRFRREMTLMAMDLVALFPYYNVRQYPNGANPQLTREIYTDPIVYNPPANQGICRRWGNNPYNTFSELENAFIRPPHLFDRLNRLTISRNRYTAPTTNSYLDYWSGHTLQSQYANNPTTYETSYGQITSNTRLFNTTNGANAIDSRARNFGNLYANLYGVSYLNIFPTGVMSEITSAPNTCWQDLTTTEELPLVNNNFNLLSHVTFLRFNTTQGGPLATVGFVPTYVWTRQDVDFNNIITPNRITQIPVVKAYELSSGATVVKGPGFTGGDVIRRTNTGGFGAIRVSVTGPLTQRYRIRFRYASTIDFDFFVTRGGTTINNFRFTRTMNRGQESRYESYRTVEFTTPFNFTQSQDIIRTSIQGLSGNGEVYLDRIEIIPVNPTREAEEDLEAAKKAVASLFTRTRDGLQVNVTDYQVDQAANLVSCLSDEQYAHDKKMLLEAVRAAKRLSRERNLLQDPDFNTINSTEENGWKASNGVTISEGGPFYKGRAIQLASARENYPTYIYQKVDASELKPYTRYRLDGFVKSSQDLEIDLIHHHKVHLVKNVPDNLVSDTYPDDSCSGINRCQEQQMVNAQLETEHHHPMDCCEAAQTHEFSSYINTGDLNASVDQGIWVVLKVRTTDGYATLGNLELVEVGPLSGEPLEREQRENAKWNAELGRKRAETDRVYQDAKQSINHLFVDYQDQQLNPEIGMADIMDAQNLVASISDVYSDAVLQIPGINYEIYTELSNRLQQASYLHTSRNAMQNGDFNSGLDSWNATAGATVQQDGNTHFLVLSHWDAQVSQQFRVQPNCKYVLRVTAEKVGGGDGYVTIRDGAHHTETLTFNACDYDINGTYVTDNTYLTKEVVFHPETQHMWVEVSETEGVFHIDSVEFMETQQ
ncbi:insecticidal delta-endotoxin Cry8Ea1 family protein (plasmid) [Bacillus cereus]|nr:insecticidal delta-endotoxin Cry8Ea1 family protein [Bacillus cereus]WBO69890.1 insecticidal delta-endotoxin Cry8Ea1 family protein [Bacillus cereus]